MDSTQSAVEVLTEEACWERLRRTSIGRLGVHHEGQPSIYPINYLVDGRSIVFRTRDGSKIYAAPRLERGAFEIDGFEPSRGDAWSVLVTGIGRFVDGITELEHDGAQPLDPWVAAERSAWVRIVPVEVSGRRFRLRDGTVTDGSVGWSDHA